MLWSRWGPNKFLCVVAPGLRFLMCPLPDIPGERLVQRLGAFRQRHDVHEREGKPWLLTMI